MIEIGLSLVILYTKNRTLGIKDYTKRVSKHDDVFFNLIFILLIAISTDKKVSKQNLIKIYHAVKRYEHCHYLTTTGWTDAQRSLVHETVLQTTLDQSSSRTVRIESNFQET